jgi:IS30 family transposase
MVEMSEAANGMKSIRQIAEKLGVDKQKVYRFIRKNRISEARQENGVMYYDKKAQTQIGSHFLRQKLDIDTSEKALASASYDVLLKQSELLAKELEIKNEQINNLNARLADMAAALISSQEAAKAAQALHAGTIQAQLGDGRNGGFLARIFHKKEADVHNQ